MVSTRADHRRDQIRTYIRSYSVVFLKTKEAFGGLSNMAGGFPLLVNGIGIRTSEALYQACRFPHLPDLQRLIIEQRSPMTAKMKSKPYRQDSRRDWNRVRVNVMRWCLRVKLAQNWDAFSELLSDTGARPIVEHSRKDDFWGAMPADEQTLVGVNALGRLLMELRESVRTETREKLLHVEPLQIEDFLLGGRPIEPVTAAASARTTPIEEASSFSSRLQIPKPAGLRLPSHRSPKVAASVVRENALKYGESELQAGLEHYPAYKDSGVEWLGAVPAHWEIAAVRRYCRVFAGATPNRAVPEYWNSGTIPWLASGDVNLRRIVGARQFITEAGHAASSTKWIRPGSLVLALAGQGRTKGMVATVEIRTTCNQSLAAIEPSLRIADHNFLAYYLESRYADIRALVGDGLRDGLNLEHVRAIVTPVPPLSEQNEIVRFLDHADRHIRRYIRAKEKLIALLEEQKQAVVHEAVTGRIDVRTGRPYPEYRDSGVEWLGDVPSHWRVAAIGRFSEVGNGSTPSRGNTAYWSSGTHPWLNSSSVNKRTITKADQFVTDRALRECHLPRVPANSVLVGITGQGRTRGMAAVLTIDATINQHLAYITPKTDAISSHYVHMFLVAAYAELRGLSSASGSTREALTCEDIKSFRLVLPPADEQEALLSAVARSVEHLERRAEDARRQIELVQEYRARLVTDVVTGKLDVCEAAAPLPEVDPLFTGDDPAGGVDQRSRA